MEFTLITPDKLKVTLGPNDLAQLGISYEKLDYTDPASKRMLISLLEQGKHEAGFHPRKSKLFIEVFPSEEGGCIIYFTCLRTGQALSGGREGPGAVVFSFSDIESVIQAATHVFARYSHRIYKSSLYRMEDGYRLLVYPLDYADHLSILFLGEFAPRTGEGEVLAAFIQEHGRSIIEDCALDTLAKYFS